jgi:hypothetical protein
MNTKKTPAWGNVKSEATEKKIDDEVKPAFPKRAPVEPVGYSSYKVIESKFENDVVKSKRRNPPKNPEMTKKLFCQVDNDIVEIIERQQATNAATINALLRYAIDQLHKNKEMLEVVL